MSKINEQTKLAQGEFSKQASNFNDPNHTIAKPEVMNWIMGHIPHQEEFLVLDAAAGTSLMGRALSPYVKRVTAYDATEAMLSQGRACAKKENIENIEFHSGLVEQMPFRDGFFDLVVCRLAFHHFLSPLSPLKEMLRVKKNGAPLILIDILSPENDQVAAIYNELEKRRDPSHVRALSASDFGRLFAQANANGEMLSSKSIEVDFEDWIKLAGTPMLTALEIKTQLQREIQEKNNYGFSAFWEKDRLKFRQEWAIFSVV